MIGKGLWKRTHKLKVQDRDGTNYTVTGGVLDNMILDYQYGRSSINQLFFTVSNEELVQSFTSDGVMLNSLPTGWEQWLKLKYISQTPPRASGPEGIALIIPAAGSDEQIMFLSRASFVITAGTDMAVQMFFTGLFNYQGNPVFVEANLISSEGSYIANIKSKILSTVS